jgi:hypothetical protein
MYYMPHYDPPSTPCGSIEVTVNKDGTDPAYEFYNYGETIGGSFTGTITWVEWAVLGVVDDGVFPPTNIKPFTEGEQFDMGFPSGAFFNFTPNQYETSKVYRSRILEFPNNWFGREEGHYYLVRVTAYGTAGYSSRVLWLQEDLIASS